MARKGLTSLTATGNTKNLDAFFKRVQRSNFELMLHKYGEYGVELLSQKTPVDTGKTAASWYYTIIQTASGYKIYWNNTSMTENNIPIAILIQYGHATKNGGYVAPNDFINPATQEVYDKLVNEIRRELDKQ